MSLKIVNCILLYPSPPCVPLSSFLPLNFSPTVVLNGGLLGSRKGVNLPGKVVNLPAISQKDKDDFKFGREQGVDMIFASFVRKVADVEEMRKELGEEGRNILIISKVTVGGGEVISYVGMVTYHLCVNTLQPCHMCT